MNQNEVALLLAAFLGYAQQWARGYRWYNDGVTLFVSLGLGGLGALWIAPADVHDFKALSWTAAGIALQLLGGTKLGNMAAQVNSPVMLAPKFNQFSQGGKS